MSCPGSARLVFLSPLFLAAAAAACATGAGLGFGDGGSGAGESGASDLGDAGASRGRSDGSSDGTTARGSGSGASGDGGVVLQLEDTGAGSAIGDGNAGGPVTCAEATASKSNIGCDYWPTVTFNPVWSIFDFTAVVANTQGVAASVTVTGPSNFNTVVVVAPNQLQKIYLPWVPALKGQDDDSCGIDENLPGGEYGSVTVPGGAYHLVSSIPVTVYQFNALEYQGVGGAPGKDWSQCPGTVTGCQQPDSSAPIGCFSFTNDASLLIPSTAMTGNYRVTGQTADGHQGGYFAVTGTVDNTTVTVTASSTAQIMAGTTTAATSPGGQLIFMLNAGDVVEVVGSSMEGTDLSGSLVQATNPVQVISGMACSANPQGAPACDHLESTVLPAETLGKDYVVTVPTSPNGAVIGHAVRFYGTVDNTSLTYSPSQPPGCPATLNAGDVVECTGAMSPACTFEYVGESVAQPFSCVDQTFEVRGNNAFSVSSFMFGGSVVDPTEALAAARKGDPSMSPMVATEQYLDKYIFLAPTDYDQSFADVVAPPGTVLTLDGAAVAESPTAVNQDWSVSRIALGSGQNGAHVISGSQAFGIQVIGYGAYTSYQYPGGLALEKIAPPPPPPPPPP